MKKKRKRRRAHNPAGKTAPPFPIGFKLRAVRLYLEEGLESRIRKAAKPKQNNPKPSKRRSLLSSRPIDIMAEG